MAKDVYETYGLGDSIDPILPDGWKEGDDLFTDAPTGEDIFAADGQEDANAGSGENEAEEADDLGIPTTDDTDDAGPDAEDGAEDPVTDGSGEAVKPTSRILKLKVNHNEYEEDLNDISDEEVIARFQKAAAYDAMKEAQNKAKFREVYDEEIQNGMTDSVAKMVASHAVGGKTYSLTDAEEGTTDTNTETSAAPVTKESPADARDFKSQVKQLKALFPDFKSMPEEVMQAYADGADLLSAYSAYRVQASEKAAKSIKKENQILKQNAASAAKAPVKGVSGGGSTNQKKEDPFLKGFDSDNW